MGHGPAFDRIQSAGADDRAAAADEAQPRVIVVVAVEIVDRDAHPAGAHELVEDLVLEVEVHVTHDLVGVVAADDAAVGDGS